MLFKNLMELCDNKETGAYNKDFTFHNVKYRVFSNRLMGYEMFFGFPDALECRGVLFDLRDTSVPVCRPPKKFFNAHEGARKFDWDKTIAITEKLDGSLISTFLYTDENTGELELGIKSKTSVTSDVSILARQVLDYPENKTFKENIKKFTGKYMTVNMEITGPSNRIVVDYEKGDRLTILNCINNRSGEVISRKTIIEFFGEDRVVKAIDTHGDPKKFIESIPPMKGIEGFVVLVNDDTNFDGECLVKIKTTEYVIKHKLKARIESPKGLFEAACSGISDDLKALYDIGSWEIGVVEIMEKYVLGEIIFLESSINFFCENNKGINRKEYAIRAKDIFSDLPCGFGIAMKKYENNDIEIDYGKTLMQSWKFYKDRLEKVFKKEAINN